MTSENQSNAKAFEESKNTNKRSTKQTKPDEGFYRCGHRRRRLCKDKDLYFPYTEKLHVQERPFQIETVSTEENPCRFQKSSSQTLCRNYLAEQLSKKYNKYANSSDIINDIVSVINLEDDQLQCAEIEATCQFSIVPTCFTTANLKENLKDPLTLINFLELQTKIYLKKIIYIFDAFKHWEWTCSCSILYDLDTNCNVLEVFLALLGEIKDFKASLMKNNVEKSFTESSDDIMNFITLFFKKCKNFAKIQAKNIEMITFTHVNHRKNSPLQSFKELDLYLIDSLVDYVDQMREIVKSLQPSDDLKKNEFNNTTLKVIEKELDRYKCIEKTYKPENDKSDLFIKDNHEISPPDLKSVSTGKKENFIELLPRSNQSENSYFKESVSPLASPSGRQKNWDSYYPTSLSKKYICGYEPGWTPLEIFLASFFLVLICFGIMKAGTRR